MSPACWPFPAFYWPRIMSAGDCSRRPGACGPKTSLAIWTGGLFECPPSPPALSLAPFRFCRPATTAACGFHHDWIETRQTRLSARVCAQASATRRWGLWRQDDSPPRFSMGDLPGVLAEESIAKLFLAGIVPGPIAPPPVFLHCLGSVSRHHKVAKETRGHRQDQILAGAERRYLGVTGAVVILGGILQRHVYTNEPAYGSARFLQRDHRAVFLSRLSWFTNTRMCIQLHENDRLLSSSLSRLLIAFSWVMAS